MVVLLLDKFTKTWNCILSLMTQKQTKKKKQRTNVMRNLENKMVDRTH